MQRLALICSAISLIAMTLIDRILGSRAEFLNAWSVVERLLGRAPAAGPSFVASRIGAIGEFVVVLAVNVAIGILLALLVRLGARAFQ